MSKIYMSDFHIHSQYSFDGHMPLRNICERAIAMGMDEIAITDHADMYAHRPYEHILDAKKLYCELENIRLEYEGRLAIRLGAELGQPQVNPHDTERFLKDNPLDFIIGSIHNIENDFDIYYYDYTQLDCNEMYSHYLDWVLELAKGYDYDVLGHLTYPLRCMAAVDIKLDLEPFYKRFEEIFEIVIKRGKGIELNVSGLHQAINDTMPSLDILKLYKKCGGSIITLGSDAHYPQHVALNIDCGIELLRKAGLDSYCTYTSREPVFHSL